LAVISLAGCGKQWKAEELVEQFIEQNAQNPEKINRLSYGRLDSTRHISDSLLLSMQAKDHAQFKAGIGYEAKTSGRILYLLRMKYEYEGDTLSNTFYMDEHIQQIVGFK